MLGRDECIEEDSRRPAERPPETGRYAAAAGEGAGLDILTSNILQRQMYCMMLEKCIDDVSRWCVDNAVRLKS